jgi:hypothetical protein
MKRIHESANPATDATTRRSGIMNRSADECLPADIYCRREDLASGQLFNGTLIHNGNCREPLSIGSLAIPLIKSSFESLPVTEVCRSTLGATSLVAAVIAAITLAPITTTAYPENGAAPTPAAKPLTQNIICGVSHSPPKARLDNGRRSCQLNGGGMDASHYERICQNGPRSVARSGSLLLSLPQNSTR